MSNAIEMGDTGTFTYEGSIQDGSTFHLHEDGPAVVVIGSGELVKGLENGIIGMEQGQDKEFEVSPEEGYGEINLDLIQDVDPEMLKQTDITLEIGLVIQTSYGNCHVTEITDDNIEISYNHPLAGETLTYSVKIINIQKK
ncbi:MAG: peptidylprolyl isomerase [Candidatus Dadabacteria bacterium]